jgi:hypothetical protein
LSISISAPFGSKNKTAKTLVLTYVATAGKSDGLPVLYVTPLDRQDLKR